MNLEQTCKAIKELKIQGAENITTAALLAIKNILKQAKAKKHEALLWELDLGKIKLFNTRSTEPEMRNYLNAFFSYAEKEETKTKLLKKVKQKKIIVYNTETRPLLQGRKTATELAKAHIPVHHYVDASMCNAIKEADCILIGADAITSEGVYNKIGSELLAILANHYHKPLYICASLYKYDAHREIIEERSPKEIWTTTEKNIFMHNPAFEKIHFK